VHECKFFITLTLEEFFHGTRHHYRFSRQLLSGKRKPVMLDVDIPPGCRPGTKILYPGVGHERIDGTLQDVIIVIEQIPHERFAREKCDLILDVELPWMKALEEEGKVDVFFEGLLEGESFEFVVDYQADKSLRGSYVFPGAGMPIRGGRRIVGRGDLIVRWVAWVISLPSSNSLISFPDGKFPCHLRQNGTH
jgi:DnaJ-class molecular chaperone